MKLKGSDVAPVVRLRPHCKVFDPVSRTKQSLAESTDINWIVDRYLRDGIEPARRPLMQGDFTQATDLQDMMNKVKKANADFMTLPAEVRREFKNDPQALLNFVSDDKNIDRAIELGLLSDEAVARRKSKEKAPDKESGAKS